MVSLGEIVVLCDKPSDQRFFNFMQKQSSCLSKIKHVEVLPLKWAEQLPEEYLEGMAPLLQFDRADYYFCYHGNPFLVVEMTVHGYTGDNCLQRFARINKTAQEGIPFIYFGPHSRTRFDELAGENPSYRNVSSDLFKGFRRLTEIYSNPVITVEWKTNHKGLPMELGIEDPNTSGLQELLDLLDELLENKINEMINKEGMILH